MCVCVCHDETRANIMLQLHWKEKKEKKEKCQREEKIVSNNGREKKVTKVTHHKGCDIDKD